MSVGVAHAKLDGTPCGNGARCKQHVAGGTGPRPRGRCPECGSDHALAPDGTMYSHSTTRGAYGPCGVNRTPMTAQQCEQWDEAERIREHALTAAWREREQQAQRGRDEEFLKHRLAFRRFDEDSFAACPWHSQRVVFIGVAPDGPATFACRDQEKRALLSSEFLILVAWPGDWSQHVFLLTDQDKAALLAKFP